MTMRALALSLAAGLALCGPATPALADHSPPTGRTCGLTGGVNDEQLGGQNTHVAQLDGGPLLGSGTLTCTILVNGTSQYAATASGTGVVVLPPESVVYVADEGDVVELCTEFATASGPTYYWDGGAWQTSPTCVAPDRAGTGDPGLDPVQEIAYALDPTLCATWRTLEGTYGPVRIGWDGDLYVDNRLVHDCPPYEDTTPFGIDVEGDVFISRVGSGGITLHDDGSGAGPVLVLSGVLGNPAQWGCWSETLSDGRQVAYCDWVGGRPAPRCEHATAIAAVLPPYAPETATARTAALCIGDQLAEIVQTDVATASAPFHEADRAMLPQELGRVECLVDDGAGGRPLPHYIAECGFDFA